MVNALKKQKNSLTFGLYSAFLARSAIVFRSSLHPKFTVDTMFLKNEIEYKLT